MTPYRITLDLNRHDTQLVLSCKQQDTARSIVITLHENGNPFLLTQGHHAVFIGKKPDGYEIVNDCTIDLINNCIRYDITPQTMKAVGIVRCEIRLFGLLNEEIASPTFNLLVREALLGETDIESSSEYGTLNVLINDVKDLLNQGVTVKALDDIYNTLSTRIENGLADLSYKAITITSFSILPSSAEMGSTVTFVRLSWELNKEATSITLNGDTISRSGTSGIKDLSGLSLKNSKTWILEVTDEKGSSYMDSKRIAFLNRVYYGKASSFSKTGLFSELSSLKGRSFTVTAGSGEYIWYAVPARMGECSFKVGGFDGGFTLVDAPNITNGSGYTEQYYLYRSDHPNLGLTNVTVS